VKLIPCACEGAAARHSAPAASIPLKKWDRIMRSPHAAAPMRVEAIIEVSAALCHEWFSPTPAEHRPT
jgi:hypothetical protein